MKERIREVRKHYNLTMEEFGARIGTTRSTISCYENGTRNPSNAVLLSISKEFNIRLEWLQTGEGEMKDPILTDETPALMLRTYKNMPERLKELVQAMVKMDPEWWKKLDAALEEVEKMK